LEWRIESLDGEPRKAPEAKIDRTSVASGVNFEQ